MGSCCCCSKTSSGSNVVVMDWLQKPVDRVVSIEAKKAVCWVQYNRYCIVRHCDRSLSN